MAEFKPPPTASKIDLAVELQKLVGDSMQNSANAFLRGLNLYKTVATHLPRENMGLLDMAKHWAQINLETSQIVSRHTQEAVNEILDMLEAYGIEDDAADAKAHHAASPPRPEDQVTIRLSAKRGQRTSTLFAVSNPGPHPMEATFAVSAFVNEDNHVVKNPIVEFAPERLKLAPNQEAAVEMAIEVSGKFRVDKCYQATVDIPEYPGKAIQLQLNVERSRAAKPARKKKA